MSTTPEARFKKSRQLKPYSLYPMVVFHVRVLHMGRWIMGWLSGVEYGVTETEKDYNNY
jgi:hypothetical protein